jgi:phosphatidate cytidylyltransferase
MSLSRLITGLLLMAIGLFTIYFGDIYLFTWVVLITILSIYELFKLINNPKLKRYEWLTYFFAILILGTTLCEKTAFIWTSYAMALGSCLVISFCFFELITKRFVIPKQPPLLFLKLLTYIIFTFPFIYLLRTTPNGLLNMFFCCFCIWATDICAYVVGKHLGSRPLTTLSPKKTIEGLLGGLLGSIIVGIIFIFYLGTDLYLTLLLSTSIPFLAQIGDIHESLIKRQFNVKDSSNLLPGHGGFLDRVDGYLLTMPLLFYILTTFSL